MGPASASARGRGPPSAWTFSKPGGCDGRPVGGGGGAGVCRVRRSRHSRRGLPVVGRCRTDLDTPQRRGATRNGRAIGPAAARRSPRPARHRQRISTWRTLIAFSKAQSAPTLLVRLPMRHASSASSQASSSSLSSSIESTPGIGTQWLRRNRPPSPFTPPLTSSARCSLVSSARVRYTGSSLPWYFSMIALIDSASIRACVGS
jgi:hypothetical protein